MVNIELTNKGFAAVVTALHDAINILEDGSFYPTQEERDDVRSDLRNALALLVEEGKDD